MAQKEQLYIEVVTELCNFSKFTLGDFSWIDSTFGVRLVENLWIVYMQLYDMSTWTPLTVFCLAAGRSQP